MEKMNEDEMKLLELEQRRYIRDNLKGSDYFFTRAGLDREVELNNLVQEVTEYGFDKRELDKQLEERNAALELLAIQENLSEEYYGNAISMNETKSREAEKSLGEIMGLLRHAGEIEPEKAEERPLTEHEQVLKKLDELKRVNASPDEKQRLAEADLRSAIDEFFG